MVHQLHQEVTCTEQWEYEMFTKRRILILAIVILAGLLSGPLTVRAVMNVLVGGTLFGGNFL